MLAPRADSRKVSFHSHERSPPELAHADHERFIEQPPLVHVLDECREALVESRQQLVLQSLKNVVVIIPPVQIAALRVDVLAAVVVVPHDRHQRHPRLDQPSPQQAGLPRAVPPIAVSQFRSFPVQLERPGGVFLRQHFECIAVTHLFVGPLHVPLALRDRLLNRLQQRLTGPHPRNRQVKSRLQRRDGQVSTTDISQRQRVVTLPEETSKLPRSQYERYLRGPIQIHSCLRKPGRELHSLQHSPHARSIGQIGRIVGAATAVVTSRHRQMERRAMVEVLVSHAPHNAQLVGHLGDLWHVLAKPHTGNGCRDGIERPANLRWGIGFRVPCIDLALATAGKDDQH